MSAEHPRRLVSRKNVPTYAPMSKKWEEEDEDEDEEDLSLPTKYEDVDNAVNCEDCGSCGPGSCFLIFLTTGNAERSGCRIACFVLCVLSLITCFVIACIDLHYLRLKIEDDTDAHPRRRSIQPTPSELPLIRITLDGNAAVSTTDEYTLGRVACTVGSVASPSARVGLRVRGSGSRTFPQNSYNLEFRQEGNPDEDSEGSLCGISGGKLLEDWRLVQTWSDASALRTKTAFEVWKLLANTTQGFFLESELVEVILNEQYMGVYLATEAIKRKTYTFLDAENKTDEHIKSTKASKGLRGILFERGGNEPCFEGYEFDYPKCSVLRETGFDGEVQNHLNRITNVLATDNKQLIESLVDVDSFVDHVLIGELFKDVDAYGRSEYFYIKNMNGDNFQDLSRTASS